MLSEFKGKTLVSIREYYKRDGKSFQQLKDFSLPDSVSATSDLLHSLRPAPESCEDLDEFVLNFFQDLPSTPVICISLNVGPDASLLEELMNCSPKVQAWILLSHLSSEDQHVILIPVHEILEEEASDDDTSSSSVIFNCKDFVQQDLTVPVQSK